MSKGEPATVLRDVQTLIRLGTIHGLTDEQLLDRFRAGPGEGAETAFAGLVARHGAMVLGVCRRALNDPNDVADAFQATFLILVRKAETVQARDSLGRWLYGVSRRVAVRAKRAAARQSAREVDGVESLAVFAPRKCDVDLGVILDEELGRLPEKYRAAVVLCDLEGLGQDEAARQLGCAVGTVKSRLSRGREKLRSRLVRRGVAPAIAAACGNASATEVPAALAEATVNAAIRLAVARAGAAGVVSAQVVDLTQGVLKAMLLTKIRILLTTMTAIAALATGAGVLARQAATPRAGGAPDAEHRESKSRAVDSPEEFVRTAPADIAVESSKDKDEDEERLDRANSLKIDKDLLDIEINAIKDNLTSLTSTLIQKDINPRRFVGPKESVDELEDQYQKELVLQARKLDDLRRRFLDKSRELRRTEQELEKLLDQRTENPDRPDGSEVRPSARDQSRISPVLKQHLSRIERKLDEVMELLKRSKR